MREPLTLETRDLAKHKLGGQWWYYFPQWKFSILAPPKCGSSSIKQFIYMNEIDVLSLRQHQVRGEAYVVVRDPVSRFCSLWRDKCRDGSPIREPIAGMSATELMDYIESGVPNVHWTHQHKMYGNLKPTFIPLEHLNDWWSQYGTLGIYNATDDEIPDINPKRIVDYYAKDMSLYTKAVLDYQSRKK